MKKYLLMTMLMLVNLVAWGETTTEVQLSGNVHNVSPAYDKYKEPTVTVVDKEDGEIKNVVTDRFNITYLIKNQTTGSLTTNAKGAKVSTDPVTGTTVEYLFGDVIFGKSGSVTIQVIATPKTGWASQYPSAPFYGEYIVAIDPLQVDLSFSPNYNVVDANNVITFNATASQAPYSSQYVVASQTTALPTYKISYTNAGGVVSNITDYYNVSINYTPEGGNDKVSFADGKLTFVGSGSTRYSTESEAQTAANAMAMGGKTGTLTYTFTPKAQYDGIYETIDYSVDVKIAAASGKQQLHLFLNRDIISEENVTTDANGTCTVHVYKYGLGDHNVNHNYQYFTPNPVLMTANGVEVPVNATRGTGAWGDFKYLYQVIDGDDANPGTVFDTDGTTMLGTYYDNCRYAPFWNNEVDVAVPAGKKALGLISDDKFQVALPGLVKVAVYAALSTAEWESQNLKALYEPLKDSNGDPIIVKDQYGADNYVYTEPVYFYIDIMKRVPELLFDPNPENMKFAKGDKIDMRSRFLVSGHIDDNSNGIEGWLLWGANTGENAEWDATIGHEVDHFAYTFFISERNKNIIKIHDWPYMNSEADWKAHGGDGFSYIDYQTVVKDSKMIGENIVVGDKVLIDDVLTEVTAGNIETIKASHPKLQIGDQEKGITYYSTRGYGEKFEKWTMEFTQTGSYDITYTIRPYNHPRWDVGTGDAGTVTYTYDVVESVPTKIDLSYTYTTTPKCKEWVFTEPVATVVVPSQNNYDVTRYFDLSYEIDSEWNNHGGSLDHVIIDETEFDGEDGEFSVYYKVTSRNQYSNVIETKAPILAINKATGKVYVGCAYTGNVVIKVSGTKKEEHKTEPYDNPNPEHYTILIYDDKQAAKYEIIAECKTEPCSNNSSNPRFTTAAEFTKEYGRFHFIRPGELYGGTVYSGVPGVDMTLGAVPTTNTDVANWFAEATAMNVKYCCSHESDEHRPVAVQAGDVIVDAEGIPTGGTFYKFSPSTNGYLSVDANWKNGEVVYLVSKNSKTGEIVSEEIRVTDDKQGDLTFEKALIAGEEYYLYNRTAGWLRLHGFAYQPAFVFNRNTTKEESIEPLKATTFMNGLSSGIPTIIGSSNKGDVTFSVPATADRTYLSVNANTGVVSPLKMTVQNDGSITYVTVSAEIDSPDASLGDCVNKTATYQLRIIDIPSYVVGQAVTVSDEDKTPTSESKYHAVTMRDQVTTTNIPTAITMTFGGWKSDYSTVDPGYEDPSGGSTQRTDSWEYKTKAYSKADETKNKDNEYKDENGLVFAAYKEKYGYDSDGCHAAPASRIGSELADYDPYYNLTIDGFNYFMGSSNPPYDERGNSPITAAAGNVYNYSSGTVAENSYEGNKPVYNTTYRNPCKGAYIKFEPEESGIVMVYLVQNGAIDYHHGTDGSKNQVKWRPLYITDETGKPVEMVNDFGSAAQYMPNYEDASNTGSYTLGLSRCNHEEDAVKGTFTVTDDNVMPGCSFDWSDFRGTQADRYKLLAAWPKRGERESIIRLDDGGFALAHKAYVRYAFRVMSGKTYFVFQYGSTYEFGGFSFVPEGYPETSKYGLTWTGAAADKSYREDVANIANCTSWVGKANGSNQEHNLEMPWHSSSDFGTLLENYNITVKDGADAEHAATRVIKNNSWTSLCLPFSVSEKQCKKLFGDDYFLLTAAGVDSKGQIHFERHAHKYIEAGRPYLLKPSSKGENDTDNENITFMFKNVTIEGSRSAFLDPTRFNVNAQEYTFKGVYTEEMMPKGSVITGGVGEASGLYTFTKDYPIGGYRAYYYLPAGVSPAVSPAKAFAYVDLTEDGEEDNATGIIYFGEDGDIQILPKNTAVYNIGGQKMGEGIDALNRLQRGLYIVNGKKFLVK